MDTKGGKPRWGGDGGVLNWAIGTDMYTLICIKLLTNKNLQYIKKKKMLGSMSCVMSKRGRQNDYTHSSIRIAFSKR